MAKTGSGDVPDTVQTAETLFDIVQCVKSGQGKTVTEVANELDYVKSTVHRHLHTLEELGYLVQRADGYHVGLRFLDLGVTARNSHTGYKLIREKVEEVAETTGERAQFFVEEHGEAVYLARSVGENAVRTDPGLGSRIPLYASSAGKAMLAKMPEPMLFDYIEQVEFEQLTPNTITDSEVLLAEIEKIQERGYSFNRQETLRGTHAVGVAVGDSNGGAIGAVSVTGPSHRLKGDRFENQLPDLLLGAANELELNIAFS
ncbi:transcriptional regulator, IclR family [Halogranum amylolyticum]|uniref:Transcriptional regulator, IclR family n=1 Tax=Halogranum amylolyticum TaxID=660520 RepID=A0A1H8WAS7_9EURY|nr:IclR family transcriptional regulator [Halogranum amylolyticum]SEP24765.1 transcriptional regulator, IclR family [Halogranum amylolyticum]